jgi:hypothetical protein
MSSLAAHPAAEQTANCASLSPLLQALGQAKGDLQDSCVADALLRAAAHHGVQPLLHRALLDAHTSIAAPAWAALQRYVRQNALRNLHLCGELARLLRLLQENGIVAVPYKGPAMAAGLWGSPDLRECADLDLLVLPHDVAKAAELLAGAGYRQLESMNARELQRHVGVAAELQFQAADGLLLELQWRIVPHCFGACLELAPIWPRLQRQTFAGEKVAALAPDDLLLVLCVHGWKHAWERSIWAADIAQLLLVHNVDCEAVRRQARALRLERILLLGLGLAQREFGAGLPPNMASQISNDKKITALIDETMARHHDGTQLSYRGWQRYMLRARDGWQDRVRHVAGFAFTPGLGEQRIARGFAPLYLPVRAARLSARAVREAWNSLARPPA